MEELSVPGHSSNIFLRMRSIHRFIISLLVAGLAFMVFRSFIHETLLLIVIIWDIFCVSILFHAGIVFFTCTPAQMRKIASREDGSRLFVFVVILLFSLGSMVAVLLLILVEKSTFNTSVYFPLGVGGMLLSWFLVHTTYTFHYAYMYYGNDDDEPEKASGGLSFPGDEEPDYLDFAYFAFVLGMTFQVSDVEINSKDIRRVALVHGLLSFSLNAFVVALSVNIIAGLKG